MFVKNYSNKDRHEAQRRILQLQNLKTNWMHRSGISDG